MQTRCRSELINYSRVEAGVLCRRRKEVTEKLGIIACQIQGGSRGHSELWWLLLKLDSPKSLGFEDLSL